jgi:diaminopimelate decarboxylase
MLSRDSEGLQDLQRILQEQTPLLSQGELHGFVEKYFGRRDDYLSILERHPPPVYVLESSVLRERARQFQRAFQKSLPEVSFYYAVKSNNYPEVSKILLQSGFGLDVSSGIELEAALRLHARDIVFSGPGKTDHELRLAALHAETVIVLMDSFGELHRLERIARGQNKAVRAGIRLTPNPRGLWRKFGIAPHDLPEFWQQAIQCNHVRVKGLQFHTSWNLSPNAQMDFIEVLGRVLAGMPRRFRDEMEFMDVGGGYWPSQGEWLQAAGTRPGRVRKALGENAGSPAIHHRLPATPIDSFAEQLGSSIQKHIYRTVRCRICLEPGRWICNDTMHLFLSVVDKKAPDLVITDAGTNAIGWERFETDYFPILNLSRPSLSERRCDILGSLCTPHDVWGYCYWGEDIQPGDLLMVPTQGAYTYSLRQQFIKPLPEVVTI